jgi:hypothetical protein
MIVKTTLSGGNNYLRKPLRSPVVLAPNIPTVANIGIFTIRACIAVFAAMPHASTRIQSAIPARAGLASGSQLRRRGHLGRVVDDGSSANGAPVLHEFCFAPIREVDVIAAFQEVWAASSERRSGQSLQEKYAATRNNPSLSLHFIIESRIRKVSGNSTSCRRRTS